MNNAQNAPETENRQEYIIKIDDIVIPDLILRHAKTDSETFTSMVETIRANGRPDEPILCRHRVLDNGAKVIELINGRQRMEASKLAGFTTIPTMFKEMSDKEAIMTQMRLNLVRIDQDPMEVGKALQKVVAMDGSKTAADLAKEIGRSVKYVEDRLRLQGIKDPAIREAVTKGEITIGNAVVLAKAKEPVQAQLVDHAKTMEAKEFAQTAATASEKYAEQKKANPDPAKPVVFGGALPKRKTLEELEAAAKDADLARAVIAGNACTTPESIFAAAILWAIDMDVNGKAAQEAAWQTKQDEKAAKDAQRKKETEERAAATAALKDGKTNPLLAQLDEKEKAIAAAKRKARSQIIAAGKKLVDDGVYADIALAMQAVGEGKHKDVVDAIIEADAKADAEKAAKAATAPAKA